MTEFIQYLQSQDLAEATQKLYSYNLSRFLAWYASTGSTQGEADPINCRKKDVLSYLDYLQNKRKMQNITRKNHLIAIDHYFNFLGLKEVTSFIKIRGAKKKKLQYIFSSEELAQLYDDYHHSFIQNYEPKKNHHERHNRTILLSRQRNYIMLGFLAHQGLATNELDLLHINDIDFLKASIKIEHKGNIRTLPLHASQIGALMNYIQHIRPQFLSGKEETDKLFLPLAEQVYNGSKSNPSVKGVIKTLTHELRKLHPNLSKLSQLRASVITHWIKAEGLRKAQYLAGHKSINSTEEYLPNNLEELTEELVKFNPF